MTNEIKNELNSQAQQGATRMTKEWMSHDYNECDCFPCAVRYMMALDKEATR